MDKLPYREFLAMIQERTHEADAPYRTEDTPDHDERPKRHWTEFLNNDDESQDRDDDWEWERQDDFGDSWDGEKEES